MAKEQTTLFSQQMSVEDKRKFQAIAEYRKQTKAGLLREWIRGAYARLPK